MVYYFLLKADPLLKGALFQEQQGGCLEGLERSWYPGPNPVGWGWEGVAAGRSRERPPQAAELACLCALRLGTRFLEQGLSRTRPHM